MTFRDTAWPEGTPCWVDVQVPDPKRAAEFYGPLLGWEFSDQGGYLIALREGRGAAAIGQRPPGGLSAWTTYLAVENADKTAAAIVEAGGRLMLEPGDVGPAGRLALAVDPAGAVFGIWQAGSTTGVQIANVPGTLVWNECLTRDYEGGKAFYEAVFGYSYDALPGGYAYSTLKVDGNIVGGIGELTSPEVSPHWSTYFGAADTDATVEKALSLGGSVLRPAEDSPYGRSAQLADDQGVPFNVISVEG
ncbi:hypothetical protein FHX82_004465 [Amycolatopsis bartoniae]|uniref:Glyoxalase n=1 Tax=Amycolatopsis bartoniae TaxID=941986 RepID=A0A8H9M802_9PSEU|nr:VOC family protein [Amycolatopsis bartoniae]MBB2937392.1 hypothetical protein [Amycolatopsis bartoniae]TVS99523.1 VOC family protein [Amycolatopsis bartoniae]GHF78688.1 glyoxalase [Amycolatopsis bartoniae]